MPRQRLPIFAAGAALLVAMGVLIGLLAPRFLGGGRAPFSSPPLLVQVKTLSQLVTVQYVIEKVVLVEDVKWVAVLGESRVLMIAHGVVKAGIDLSRLQPEDIQVRGKTVSIKLPNPQITDAYLDDKQTRVVERTTGLLREFDKDLEQTARQNAVEDIRRAARTGGILKDARERAELQIRAMFVQLGYERVEFRASN
jgi:hypothetical protein